MSPERRRMQLLRITQRESIRSNRDREIETRLNRDEQILNREIEEAANLYISQPEEQKIQNED